MQKYSDWYTGGAVMDGLLHLVQREGAWAGCGPAQSPHRCTICNSTPINGQCTDFILFDVVVPLPLTAEGLRGLCMWLASSALQSEKCMTADWREPSDGQRYVMRPSIITAGGLHWTSSAACRVAEKISQRQRGPLRGTSSLHVASSRRELRPVYSDTTQLNWTQLRS